MPGWSTFAAFLDEARAAPTDEARQSLVEALEQERRYFPWIQGSRATFIYRSGNAVSVALNLDTIHADPPLAPLERLTGTDLWYLTREFAPDDLLDYLIAVDDPLTPVTNDPNLAARVLAHWHPDPLNPLKLDVEPKRVSVIRMNDARPFPDWSVFRLPRGDIREYSLDSAAHGFVERKLWLYTPPNADNRTLPLLILHDGQWMAGALQAPHIANALIKHERMQPAAIAMIQSGDEAVRNREYLDGEAHLRFLTQELIPFVAARARIDPTHIAVGGVALGAVAAARAALTDPGRFRSVILISPPLGKGVGQDDLRDLVRAFADAPALPARIFQSVGRYEGKARFYRPAQTLRAYVTARRTAGYLYAETGSGHGLVGFRSILPEALAWALPYLPPPSYESSEDALPLDG